MSLLGCTPRYSWKIAKVGAKYQSINQYWGRRPPPDATLISLHTKCVFPLTYNSEYATG